MSTIFNISLTNLKSAIVFAILTAVVAMMIYVIGLGDIFLVDTRTIVNIGAMSLLNGILSLLKSFLTNANGEFLGVTKVIGAKASVNRA